MGINPEAPKFICEKCRDSESCEVDGVVICPGMAVTKLRMRHNETDCDGRIIYVGQRGIYKARRV